MRRWLSRLGVAAALAGLPATLASQTREANPPCQGLLKRLDRLVDLYSEAGKVLLGEEADPGRAMQLARQRAMKGNPQATIALVGVSLVTYGRRDVFPVATIRQVCNLGARNAIPIHVVTCAYFNALNPFGDKDEKRVAVEAEITRFEKNRTPPPVGTFAAHDEFRDHIDALKACLPRA